MSVSVTLKSYFYEVLIPSSQKNTSSPIEDILHHVSISFMKKLALYKCFNPRTHTGCDRTARQRQRLQRGFNPRTHTGCDAYALNNLQSRGRCFNPRTHTGCDNLSRKSFPRPCCFNPRTHTGCDDPKRRSSSGLKVSIHAPTRGATQASLSNTLASYEFQSTHPHGVRPLFHHIL